ncbi:DUF4625 domain-containing protein [uncultured Algoriphagus sp.]|uniref:DUF4625 domain-containing protein n=1 Tax=uncultured Algoriphagus sp. TaxID=417365 RepID=UPI0030EF820B|tara:strand:+ start:9134 stop:9601 length:468 start_codon:yes stop_codon:yes gene_type:complete
MKLRILPVALVATLLLSCNEDETPAIDLEYPEIVVTENSFPVQCSIVERGDIMHFKAFFTDNAELGSYSLDIHHNFDHHTHSTEVNDCEMDAEKSPVNPWLLIDGFTIPANQQSYTATMDLKIPEDVDIGDYHFMIKLTDKEGWQTIQGISIQIE